MGWPELIGATADRGGVLATRRAPDHGISQRALQRRSASERWPHPQPGVVALPGVRLDFATHARAAVEAGGDRTLVGGRAALHLAGVGDEPSHVDVVVPHARDVRLREPVRRRRSRTLLQSDAMSIDGIALTTVARSLYDVAAWESADAAIGLLLEACQKRRTNAAEIRARGDLRTPIRGRSALLEACNLVDAGIQSAFEARILPVLQKAGFPAPVPQAAVRTGGRTLHVDFGWPDRHVGIECLGLRYHNDRVAMRRDVARMNALGDVRWRIVWVEWDALLRQPDEVVSRVAAALFRGQTIA